MHYEINVSKDGKHFFATHERSLRSIEEAHLVAATLKTFLPESQGYEITMTKWDCVGRRVEI